MNLFGLVGEFKELYGLMTEDPDSEVINDTLEAVTGEIEKKSEGYVAVINQLDMELDACTKQIEQWTYRKKVRENGIKRLKERLLQAMLQMGKTELPAGDNTIKIEKNGGKTPLRFLKDETEIPQNMVDISTIPKKYRKTVITETIDTDKVREDLDAGKELDFVEYGTRGQHIRVR